MFRSNTFRRDRLYEKAWSAISIELKILTPAVWSSSPAVTGLIFNGRARRGHAWLDFVVPRRIGGTIRHRGMEESDRMAASVAGLNRASASRDGMHFGRTGPHPARLFRLVLQSKPLRRGDSLARRQTLCLLCCRPLRGFPSGPRIYLAPTPFSATTCRLTIQSLRQP